MSLLDFDQDILLKVALHEYLGHDCYTALETAGKFEVVMQAVKASLDRQLLGGTPVRGRVSPTGILESCHG
jgi:hypothetical protein